MRTNRDIHTSIYIYIIIIAYLSKNMNNEQLREELDVHRLDVGFDGE